MIFRLRQSPLTRISYIIDILRNPIHLLNLHFLASALQNFFAMCLHIAKKFCKELAEKSSNFSNKAGYARCLILWKIAALLIELGHLSGEDSVCLTRFRLREGQDRSTESPS